MILCSKLISSRIVIRDLCEADATLRYLEWIHDPEVNRFLESRFSPPKNVVDLAEFIRVCSKSDNTLLLGMFLADQLIHIGNIKLGPINWHHKTADIGFLVGEKSQWGKGFATEAISVVCEYAFLNLGLEKLTAGTYEENLGSQKTLLKCGFIREGVLRNQWVSDGRRQNGFVFGKLRTAD